MSRRTSKRRKRRHIPIQEIAAAALATMLPQAERDQLRAEQAPAARVLRRFTPDHIKLHTWGGSDRWWNLDMRLRGLDLKLKDRRDTSRAAKSVRVESQWRDFTRIMAKPGKRRVRRKRRTPLRWWSRRAP